MIVQIDISILLAVIFWSGPWPLKTFFCESNLGFHSHGKLFSQLVTKRGVEKSCRPKIMYQLSASFWKNKKPEIIYAFFFCSCLQRFLHTTRQKWILMLWVSDSIIKVVRHHIIICRRMNEAGATLSQQFYERLSLLDFGIPQSPQNRGQKNSKSI